MLWCYSHAHCQVVVLGELLGEALALLGRAVFVPHIDVELNARGVVRPQTGLNDAVHHVGGAGVWQADAPIGDAVAGRKVLRLRARERQSGTGSKRRKRS